MRLPRDVSGDELARRLGRLGYAVTRQTGSHMRLTTSQPREHHVTIPKHNPLSLGTLRSILDDVAGHRDITRDQLLTQLFG
ncbi:MAG TPA: type II toxin-antitoxin system HicA family toxin [Thermoanaerobaculia bacterium]|nr:type II toxin-antitoxin system HicA family toxin [Thermoanaerobaculia bacterium]